MKEAESSDRYLQIPKSGTELGSAQTSNPIAACVIVAYQDIWIYINIFNLNLAKPVYLESFINRKH